MKFHIVRNDETLEDILYLYNLSKDELIEQNRHIRVWNKLIPGTKLRIPPIPESVQQEVTEMEPFVEDYYPKLSQEVFSEKEEFTVQNNDEDEIDIVSTENDPEEMIDTQGTYSEKKKEETSSKDDLQAKKEAIKKEVMEKIQQMNSERTDLRRTNNNQGYFFPIYKPYPYMYYPINYQKRP